MICAPSNAAVNHIIKRVKTQGVLLENNTKHFPKIIRTGVIDTDDRDILSCSLDHLCEEKLMEVKGKQDK